MELNIKHIFKYLLLMPLMVAFTVACSKYDSPENVHYDDYGIVYTYNNPDIPKANFYIVRDDGVTLYIKALNTSGEFIPTDGQRVRCNYEILSKVASDASTTRVAGVDEYGIKLYSIFDVRTKDPVKQSFEDEDPEWWEQNIGTDPLVKVTKMYYSGKYVNVEFTYLRKSDVDHFVNLVVSEPDEKGVVKAVICHNADGDMPQGGNTGSFREVTSEVSFDLSTLIPEDKDSVMIEFEWLEYGRQLPRTESKLFTRNPKGNTLIVGSIDSERTSYHYWDDIR